MSVDTMPIGTILTVPKNWFNESYIDYQNYLKLDKYPKLAAALGSKYLNPINMVPAGAIQFGLADFEMYTWKQWDEVGALSKYPQLKCFISEFIQNLPLGEVRTLWENAHKLDVLPDISGLFFRADVIGGVFSDGQCGGNYFYPMIEHTENVLKSLGRSTPEEPKKLYSSVIGEDVRDSNIPANFVLLGQDASIHRLEQSPRLIESGTGGVGFPAHMTVKVLVNTEYYYPSVPRTHKIVIKTV